jgi:hypothetical protein
MANIERLRRAQELQRAGTTGIKAPTFKAAPAKVETPSTQSFQQIGQSKTSQGRRFMLPDKTGAAVTETAQTPTRATILEGGGRSQLSPDLIDQTPAVSTTADIGAPSVGAPPSFDLNTPEGIRAFQQSQISGIVDPVMGILRPQTEAGVQRAQDEIARLEGLGTSRLQPLMDLAAAQKEAMRSATQRQIQQSREQTRGAQEQLATRFGFSGFGQSTRQQQGQADLLVQQQQAEEAFNRALLLEESKIDAQLAGATDEEIERINAAINAERANIDQLQAGIAQKESEMKLQALGVAQEATQKMIEQLGVSAEEARQANLELSAGIGFLVDQFGQPILNNAGNIVELPEGVKQQFISATKQQRAGVFDPITGTFTPLGGGGVGGGGVVGGGGRGFGGATSNVLNMSPERVEAAESILRQVNSIDEAQSLVAGLGFGTSQEARLIEDVFALNNYKIMQDQMGQDVDVTGGVITPIPRVTAPAQDPTRSQLLGQELGQRVVETPIPFPAVPGGALPSLSQIGSGIKTGAQAVGGFLGGLGSGLFGR